MSSKTGVSCDLWVSQIFPYFKSGTVYDWELLFRRSLKKVFIFFLRSFVLRVTRCGSFLFSSNTVPPHFGWTPSRASLVLRCCTSGSICPWDPGWLCLDNRRATQGFQVQPSFHLPLEELGFSLGMAVFLVGWVCFSNLHWLTFWGFLGLAATNCEESISLGTFNKMIQSNLVRKDLFEVTDIFQQKTGCFDVFCLIFHRLYICRSKQLCHSCFCGWNMDFHWQT